jgi:tetratricopeptide (TPR) repeat protein
MAKYPITEESLPDPETMKPEKTDEYAERGYRYFSEKKYELAAKDFSHIVDMESGNIEAWYALGLTLKWEGEKTKAVDAFQHVLNLIGNIPDSQRANVLGRLTKGHINMITTGDWNLEKEVWKSR